MRLRGVPNATAVVLAAIAWAQPASASMVSTFGTDAGGWTVVTSYPLGGASTSQGAPVWHAAGGNPGGYVSTTDPNNDDTYFSAPATFLGNQSAALNGRLSFDRIITTGAIDYSVDYDMVLRGGGTTLRYDLPLPSQLERWESYSATLGAGAGWINNASGLAATQADFQTVLADVSDLWLLAEFTFGLLETIGIDNVALTDARVVDAPEPASIALFLAALGIGAAARKRPRA